MKLKFFTFLVLAFTLPNLGCAQEPHQEKANCMDLKFDNRVNELLSFTVPVMDVEELKNDKDNVIILDAREKEEYDISHIEGAKYIGYNQFSKKDMKAIPKDAKIVVYCSVGYRSEKIGEQLQKMGYTDVNNLFGSIFEWVNRGNEVVDKNGNTTVKVHTYNKKWSQWVKQDRAEKTW
jgi:rhodanese-related sulfurtransferase